MIRRIRAWFSPPSPTQEELREVEFAQPLAIEVAQAIERNLDWLLLHESRQILVIKRIFDGENVSQSAGGSPRTIEWLLGANCGDSLEFWADFPARLAYAEEIANERLREGPRLGMNHYKT